MKLLTVVGLVWIGFIASVHAQKEVPSIVAEGFSAYQDAGPNAALAAWLRASPLESDTPAKNNLKTVLDRFQSDGGKLLGFDVIRRIPVSPVFERVYVLIRFEKAPLFASFDCYRASSGWIVADLNLNPKMTDVVPASLLHNSK